LKVFALLSAKFPLSDPARKLTDLKGISFFSPGKIRQKYTEKKFTMPQGGGLFTLITNDGKQDFVLMATAFLHERLRSINALNMQKNGGRPDDRQNMPSLLDIERTHILFTNAHFKPFVAMGFEYNRVNAGVGNPTLGSEVQFNIPHFGDFIHDIAAHVLLRQPTLTPTGGTADSDSPLMRWCHFPGERLFQQVIMEVNGNSLDDYTYHSVNMHREFRVAPNKRLGWDRCVGQEEAESGFLSQPNWALSGVAPADITHRFKAEVNAGAQTPTGQKDQTTAGYLEMFIPLLFWFNKDVRLAVPSVAIPAGARFIKIQLATTEELVNVYPRGSGTWASPNGSLVETNPTLVSIALYVNNIFLNPEVHKIYIKLVGFTLIRVHRQHLQQVSNDTENVHLQLLKWPIEYLFVGMKVRSYHAGSSATSIRQSLDRWHTFHQVGSNTWNTTGQTTFKESALVEDPTDTLGMTALGVLDGTATAAQAIAVGDTLRIRGTYFTVTVGVAAAAALTGVTVAPAPAVAITASAAIAADSAHVVRQGLQADTVSCAKTLNSIEVSAHGVPIYQAIPTKFFNAYLPYHFGGPNINVPEDCNVAFVPFCLYPGTYQPSGHLNVSRAREFYINIVSSVIDNSTPGTLVVIASALNFLLVSDGNALLRYTT
jgi:hypothetical protein